MAFRIRHLLRLLYYNFSTCESKKKLGLAFIVYIGDPYIPLFDMFFSYAPEQHILTCSSPFMEWRTIVCRNIGFQ